LQFAPATAKAKIAKEYVIANATNRTEKQPVGNTVYSQ